MCSEGNRTLLLLISASTLERCTGYDFVLPSLEAQAVIF